MKNKNTLKKQPKKFKKGFDSENTNVYQNKMTKCNKNIKPKTKISFKPKDINYKINYSNPINNSSEDESHEEKFINNLIGQYKIDKNNAKDRKKPKKRIKVSSKQIIQKNRKSSDLSINDIVSLEDKSPERKLIINKCLSPKKSSTELHKESLDKINNINKGISTKKKDLEIGEYGLLDMDFITFEKKENVVETNDEALIPWLTNKTRQSKGMLKLHFEIIDFFNFMAPTPEEDVSKKETVRYLKNLIKENWPKWKVKTFGSFPNKLHLPDSDIDIVVISENSDNALNQLRMLKKIANRLLEDQKVDFLRIIEAKVPIIRATFKNTKINVDISANRKNGYAAKKVIARILKCYPFLRPLIYLLKYFLKQRKLNETYTGGISSFLLFNLLLSFIQVRKKEMLNENDQDLSLGHLLCGFLQFYCFDFNYDNVGISVRYGGYFFKKSERNWEDDNRPYLLCVENFQDPDQDIGKSCFRIKRVLETFKFARDNLFYPSKYPIDSYLKNFIQIDKFTIDRLNYLKSFNKSAKQHKN